MLIVAVVSIVLVDIFVESVVTVVESEEVVVSALLLQDHSKVREIMAVKDKERFSI
jgi:hypothetical protein